MDVGHVVERRRDRVDEGIGALLGSRSLLSCRAIGMRALAFIACFAGAHMGTSWFALDAPVSTCNGFGALLAVAGREVGAAQSAS